MTIGPQDLEQAEQAQELLQLGGLYAKLCVLLLPLVGGILQVLNSGGGGLEKLVQDVFGVGNTEGKTTERSPPTPEFLGQPETEQPQ